MSDIERSPSPAQLTPEIGAPLPGHTTELPALTTEEQAAFDSFLWQVILADTPERKAFNTWHMKHPDYPATFDTARIFWPQWQELERQKTLDEEEQAPSTPQMIGGAIMLTGSSGNPYRALSEHQMGGYSSFQDTWNPNKTPSQKSTLTRKEGSLRNSTQAWLTVAVFTTLLLLTRDSEQPVIEPHVSGTTSLVQQGLAAATIETDIPTSLTEHDRQSEQVPEQTERISERSQAPGNLIAGYLNDEYIVFDFTPSQTVADSDSRSSSYSGPITQDELSDNPNFRRGVQIPGPIGVVQDPIDTVIATSSRGFAFSLSQAETTGFADEVKDGPHKRKAKEYCERQVAPLTPTKDLRTQELTTAQEQKSPMKERIKKCLAGIV